jgi:L-threonylcarbamoyladenylate synthase
MNERGRILPTHTRALFETAVREAAALLRAGEVVAIPTETVYGLAANALDRAAVNRIFTIKGRPAHNPIIVHVSSLDMARRCSGAWPGLADRLASAFWPGPLTLVVPRSIDLPDMVTAGGSTVGLRWPRHPFVQALIQACGFPLAAPSANQSGEVSPTIAEHVRKSLGDNIPLIVDGGAAQIGIESTVLDVTSSPPRLLRPGMIHSESLRAVLGELDDGYLPRGEPLRSPGLLLKHYSPKAKLVVWQWRDEASLNSQLSTLNFPPTSVCVITHGVIPMKLKAGNVCVIPNDPEAFARAIYAELHRCDDAGARLIVVEAPPATPEWQAISDRLRRAAA